MGIVTNFEEISRPCEPVKTLAEGLAIGRRLQQELQTQNKRALKSYRKSMGKGESLQVGIGLAANQIGIQKQVCLIQTTKVPILLVNPRIIAVSGSRFEVSEQCLSLPGEKVTTKRHQWVMVQSINGDGQPQVFGVQDMRPGTTYQFQLLQAAAVQHEIAHLAGLTIFDFAADLSTFPEMTTWFK